VTHGLRKKPTDFGGNPDHVTAGLGLGRGYGYGYVGTPPYSARVTRRLFNGYNLAT